MLNADDYMQSRSDALSRGNDLWEKAIEQEAAPWRAKLAAMAPAVIKNFEEQFEKLAVSDFDAIYNKDYTHPVMGVHISYETWLNTWYKMSRWKKKSLKLGTENGSTAYMPSPQQFPEGGVMKYWDGEEDLELTQIALELTEAFLLKGLRTRLHDTWRSAFASSIDYRNLDFEHSISSELISRIKTHFNEFGWAVDSFVGAHVSYGHSEGNANQVLTYYDRHYKRYTYHPFDCHITFAFRPIKCDCGSCSFNLKNKVQE